MSDRNKLNTSASAHELYTEYLAFEEEYKLFCMQFRFGQWVCYRYLKLGESWPELYYAPGPKAFELLNN